MAAFLGSWTGPQSADCLDTLVAGMSISLRFLRAGWTTQSRREFFQWLVRAQAYKGGDNMRLVIEELKAGALDCVPPPDRHTIEDLLNAPVPMQTSPISAQARPFVKEWTMADVAPLFDT